MTEEQKKISKRNNKKARKYFGLKGYEYVLHHINPDWKYNDVERYIQWNIEDLVVMSRSEHQKLHSSTDNGMSGKHHSDESKHKMSIHHSENSGHRIHHTDEGKKHISESKKGKPNDKNKGKNNGIHKISAAYKEYKANGGTEKWTAFQKSYKKQKAQTNYK